MRRVFAPVGAIALVALALTAGGCSQRSALAAPVGVMRSAPVPAGQEPVAPGTAAIFHTPIITGLDAATKEALGWDAIDWLKQDVLVVHLGGTGRRLDGLRAKGDTLFVQTTADWVNGATCVAAVIEKVRATHAVIELN